MAEQSPQPSRLEASERERGYVAAMSRAKVVAAYRTWTSVSAAERVCLEIAFAEGDSVLDLGCGAGRLASYLGDQCGEYLGIDASPEMVAAARRNFPGLHFEVQDILKLKRDMFSTDVILLMGNVLDCLHPNERRLKLIDRCAQWLKPGGHVVGSTHLPPEGEAGDTYYRELYHGAEVWNYRATMATVIDQVEFAGLEMAVVVRDYRDGPYADWFYWVARQRS